MLKDLGKADRPLLRETTDVAIVGAGVAGLILATSFAKRGIRTIALESGAETSASVPDPLNTVVLAGQPYRGAEDGRFRGLGGTSLRWGGAMLPFLPCDMGAHTARWPVHWPVTFDRLEPKFAELERLFRLPRGPWEVEMGDSAGAKEPAFITRSAKLPAFRLRNVATAVREYIAGKDTEIWLHATVVDFQLNDSGRIASVEAVSPSGARLSVKAKIVMIAAGAIESTRLVLLLDARHGERIFRPDGQLGRYFHDHLFASAANIIPFDRTALNRTFAMRFAGSGMRDIRIEPSPALRAQLGLPGAFAQVRARSDGESGFAALRGLYLDRQSRSPLRWRHLARLGRDANWLAQAAWWRFAGRRLLAPRNSSFELGLVIEQFPDARNTISLAANRVDRYGTPLAEIAWNTNPQDYQTFRTLQLALTAYWKISRFAALGTLNPVPESVFQDELRRASDFFHPGGATRMGRDAASGVLDADLRTYRIDNLYVVSTSAFPSGGGANPTFMLMAFALRAAEQVADRLSRADTVTRRNNAGERQEIR